MQISDSSIQISGVAERVGGDSSIQISGAAERVGSDGFLSFTSNSGSMAGTWLWYQEERDSGEFNSSIHPNSGFIYKYKASV